MAIPDERATFKGRLMDLDEFSKPGEGEREADLEVSMLCKSCGFVAAEY